MGATPSASGWYGLYSPGGTFGLRRFTTSIAFAGGITTRSFMCPTTSSARMITGSRYCSLRLKARIVKSNISWGLEGDRAMIS